MADYIITSNGMVPVDRDSLQHWKYLKKKRVNGKWRYWYDAESLKNDVKDKLGVDERERAKQASKTKNTAYLRKWAAKSNLDSFVEGKKKYPDNQHTFNKTEETKRYDAVKKEEQNFKTAEKEYDKAVAEYLKTPIGKLESAPSRALNKGKALVKKLKAKNSELMDKAGVDERGHFKNASKNKAEAIDEVQDAQKWMNTYSETAKNARPEIKEHLEKETQKKVKVFEKELDEYQTAASEYDKTLAEYLNTPLGKIENALFYIEGKRYFDRYYEKKKHKKR